MDSVWDCMDRWVSALGQLGRDSLPSQGPLGPAKAQPRPPDTHSRLNQILCNRIVLDVQWHIGSHKLGRSGNRANHHAHSLSL